MQIERIKLKLGLTADNSQDDLLVILLSDAIDYMTTYIGTDTIPKQLEFIAEEVAIKRYRRLGSEGISTETIDVLSTKYNTDDFLEFRAIMDVYANRTTKKGYKLL